MCTLPTTASGLGALDFDLKVASLHIQWMGRLPLDDPSKSRLLALFWLDRLGLPFGGWEEILNGLNVPVSGTPTFYVTIVKQYYRFRDEDDAQLLWGNPGIVDPTGKPLRVRTLARAGISIVRQLINNQGMLSRYRYVETAFSTCPARW